MHHAKRLYFTSRKPDPRSQATDRRAYIVQRELLENPVARGQPTSCAFAWSCGTSDTFGCTCQHDEYARRYKAGERARAMLPNTRCED